MRELVSVIVPVYKAESYLSECVDSILSQTYSRLELILVDDGSPDHSGEICDQYALKDYRVRVIHKKNAGVAEARNTGLEATSGSYIMFVDSDDWIDADTVQVLYDTLKNYDADIVECGYRFIHPYKIVPVYDDHLVYELTGIEEIFSSSIQINAPHLYKVCWGKLYKKNVCEGIHFPKRTVAEDAAFCDQVFLRCNKIVKIHRAFYNYRMTDNSIMRSKISETVFQSLDTALEMKELLLESGKNFSQNLWDTVNQFIEMTAIGTIERILMSGLQPSQINGYDEFRQKCQEYTDGCSGSVQSRDFKDYILDPEQWIRNKNTKLMLKRYVYNIKGIVKELYALLFRCVHKK